MTLTDAVDASIRAAADSGVLDPALSKAAVEMLQKMAATIDAAEGDEQVFRYVTPASFLTYCEKLNLLPGEQSAKNPTAASKLVELKQKRKKSKSA